MTTTPWESLVSEIQAAREALRSAKAETEAAEGAVRACKGEPSDSLLLKPAKLKVRVEQTEKVLAGLRAALPVALVEEQAARRAALEAAARAMAEAAKPLDALLLDALARFAALASIRFGVPPAVALTRIGELADRLLDRANVSAVQEFGGAALAALAAWMRCPPAWYGGLDKASKAHSEAQHAADENLPAVVEKLVKQ
jgi:hypothetical protein